MIKVARNLFVLAVVLAAMSGAARAQTNYITVTNYVTVVVTNFVVLTNIALEPISLTAPVAVAPEKKAKDAWNQAISAGLTLERGNADITMVSADYQASKKTSKNELLGSAALSFGEQDSTETAQSYKASIQWNHFVTEHFYDYLRTDGLRDYVAQVNYRFTGGPGLGYYFLRQTNYALSFETGGNYEAQELGDVDTSFATVRLADKFEYKLNSHARIWQNFEIFPQVDQWDNYAFNLEIGAETSFTKSLSLKAYVDDTFNNRPASETTKNDIRLVTGVAYKF